MKLEDHLRFIIWAHRQESVKPVNAYRLFDKKTPYSIHPIWCAMTILTETSLPEALRKEGFLVLLYHDILEDTKAKLPKELAPKIRESIKEMTYGSFAKEMREIWNRPSKIKLFKVYDKVSNLLDGTWMDEELRRKYTRHTSRLIKDVEANFGKLNIVMMGRAVVTF